jgi:hypothetical protein
MTDSTLFNDTLAELHIEKQLETDFLIGPPPGLAFIQKSSRFTRVTY